MIILKHLEKINEQIETTSFSRTKLKLCEFFRNQKYNLVKKKNTQGLLQQSGLMHHLQLWNLLEWFGLSAVESLNFISVWCIDSYNKRCNISICCNSKKNKKLVEICACFSLFL